MPSWNGESGQRECGFRANHNLPGVSVSGWLCSRLAVCSKCPDWLVGGAMQVYQQKRKTQSAVGVVWCCCLFSRVEWTFRARADWSRRSVSCAFLHFYFIFVPVSSNLAQDYWRIHRIPACPEILQASRLVDAGSFPDFLCRLSPLTLGAWCLITDFSGSSSDLLSLAITVDDSVSLSNLLC